MASSSDKWKPILVRGTVVIDGAQRVLVARKHGIKAIPYIKYKGS